MKTQFQLKSPYKPAGDQPEAIESILTGFQKRQREQVLLGVTGSGKTFTMAHVIHKLKRPTLVISHNKTLAAQLFQEFKEFFPKNAVSYFVSYYDYYQPEAYLPSSNTYIEKSTDINVEIDKLRLSATANLLSRPDTIVVASVSSIYNIGSPKEYGTFILELKTGMSVRGKDIIERLVQLQYTRNNWDFTRGTFRVRGDVIDLFPSYEDLGIRMSLREDVLVSIERIDTLKGHSLTTLPALVICPAKHFITDSELYKSAFAQIQSDLDAQVKFFEAKNKLIEAQRIRERVMYDLEMISEVGYVNGIENYSRYFDKRKPGDPPYTLFDFYEESMERFYPHDKNNNWLLIVDESHVTIPQIRGMYHGDRARKQTLVDYGFRLPSALDNRPYAFDEFIRRMPRTLFASATPSTWELTRSHGVVEQLVRPTGLLDPSIDVRPAAEQINDVVKEIQKRVKKNERTLVTTLTKRMAEDLSDYLKTKNLKVTYLHSDVETLERTEILASLRSGTFDVIIGVNLLREGLDLPEVSLVAILDADKEGFLRDETSLIQTMGRASRHIQGSVILYADHMTTSLTNAIQEIDRRRTIQIAYNKKHHITPLSITKPIRDNLVSSLSKSQKKEDSLRVLSEKELDSMTPKDKKFRIRMLTRQMALSSSKLDFEEAAHIRDVISQLV